MKPFGLALVALLLAAAGATAADSDFRISSRSVRDEVRRVVGAQLEALARGDFASAYDLAAVGIKRQFSRRTFGAMIRRGYPALVNPSQTDLGIVRDDGAGEARIDVTVLDRLGRKTIYQYRLAKESARWGISAVVPVERPPRGDI